MLETLVSEPSKCVPKTKTIIKQTIEKVKDQNEMTRPIQVTTKTKENEHLLMLSYKVKARQKSLQNTFKSIIPGNNTCKIIYTGTKLAS